MERKFDKKYFLSFTRKKGRPILVDDEMLQIIRDVIIGARLEGTVISRKMVIAIGTCIIKANERILKEFGGSLELTGGWARNVLKNMAWVKRKRKTEKVEPCVKFLKE